MCPAMKLPELLKSVKSSEKLQLNIFFTAKSHTIHAPFRAIVTAMKSWQFHVDSFLCKHFTTLELRDSFTKQNSEYFIDLVGEGAQSIRRAYSVNVENLFYLVPHETCCRSESALNLTVLLRFRAPVFCSL